MFRWSTVCRAAVEGGVSLVPDSYPSVFVDCITSQQFLKIPAMNEMSSHEQSNRKFPSLHHFVAPPPSLRPVAVSY